GQKLEAKMPFRPGDRIAAGHLTIEFLGAGSTQLTRDTVEFVENEEQFSSTATPVVASLDAVLGTQANEAATMMTPPADMNKTPVMTGNPQMWALIKAGRELAGH